MSAPEITLPAAPGMDQSDFLEAGNHAGLFYAVVRGPRGHRNGYVYIPRGHPWYGKEYLYLNAAGVRVHGGLTYTKAAAGGFYWLVGFDTGHFCDRADPELRDAPNYGLPNPRADEIERRARDDWDSFSADEQAALVSVGLVPDNLPAGGPVVRPPAYVREQCEKLCEQAAAAARSSS